MMMMMMMAMLCSTHAHIYVTAPSSAALTVSVSCLFLLQSVNSVLRLSMSGILRLMRGNTVRYCYLQLVWFAVV